MKIYPAFLQIIKICLIFGSLTTRYLITFMMQI